MEAGCIHHKSSTVVPLWCVVYSGVLSSLVSIATGVISNHLSDSFGNLIDGSETHGKRKCPGPTEFFCNPFVWSNQRVASTHMTRFADHPAWC